MTAGGRCPVAAAEFDGPGLNRDVSALTKTINQLLYRQAQADQLRLHLEIWVDHKRAKARLEELDGQIRQGKGQAQELIDSLGERLAGLQELLSPLMLGGSEHHKA